MYVIKLDLASTKNICATSSKLRAWVHTAGTWYASKFLNIVGDVRVIDTMPLTEHTNGNAAKRVRAQLVWYHAIQQF